MSDFITAMARVAAERAGRTRETAAVTGLSARLEAAPPPRPIRLREGSFAVIAETKLAGPAQGPLVAGGDVSTVLALAEAFATAGAVAVSVLTEETRFGGSLSHLEVVAAHVDVPVMRKDFLVDPIQVDEARAAGASGVLLIARLLPGELVVEMTDRALSLGMFVLVEVFDRSDLETAFPVFDRDVLIGVNCRDLGTLEVDKTRFRSLAPHLPDLLPAVAESGIESEEDVMAVSELGYRLALVGSSLVTSERPGETLAGLIEAGRSVPAGSQ